MNTAAPPPGRGQALQRGLLERLRGGAGSPIGGRAGWSLVVELLQLASSTLVFLVLVQFMPQETFGELGALLALAFPALSVATLGSHYLLLRRSSQGGDLADAWKRATTVGFVGPILAAGLMIALRPLLLPNVDPWAYALVFIGNLPFYWMNELAVYLGVGTGRMKQAAQARFILVIWRFMALGWFAIWGDGSLVAWALASALSFVGGGFGALLFVHRSYGLRPGFERTSFTDLPPGIPFSANSVNESLVDSSDRWLLVRFGHLDDAALYTLGARVVQFGYLPLRTLLRAYDADLFGEGQYGVRATLAVTRRMIKPGMGDCGRGRVRFRGPGTADPGSGGPGIQRFGQCDQAAVGVAGDSYGPIPGRQHPQRLRPPAVADGGHRTGHGDEPGAQPLVAARRHLANRRLHDLRQRNPAGRVADRHRRLLGPTGRPDDDQTPDARRESAR